MKDIPEISMIFKKLKRIVQSLVSQKTVAPLLTQTMIGIFIIVVAHFIGSFIASLVERQGEKYNIEDERQRNLHTVYKVLSQVIYWIIIIVTCLAVMNLFGVQTASIIAILSTMGLAVGLAVQGILTNIATGIMLTIFNAYNIGDVIEIDNRLVRVKKFNLITTEVEEIPTGTQLIIPNGRIKSNIWINHSRAPVRRHVFHVLISNKIDDLTDIIEIIANVLKESPEVVQTEKPVIGVGAMDTFGTTLEIVVPIRSKDYPDAVLPIQTSVRDVLIKKKIKLLDGRGA